MAVEQPPLSDLGVPLALGCRPAHRQSAAMAMRDGRRSSEHRAIDLERILAGLSHSPEAGPCDSFAEYAPEPTPETK